MSMQAENPRAIVGDNDAPDWAKITTDRLADEYRPVIKTLTELITEAESKTEEVATDAEALERGGIIKRFRDLDTKMENIRATEKEEPLRKGNAIDAFFNSYRKMIQKTDKNERRTNPGYIDILQLGINAYQDRKEAAERERLRLAQLETERIANEARAKSERDAAEAQRRRDEAERARKPEIIEKKTDAADKAAAAAVGSSIAATTADALAEEAHIATLAKPADIVRVQGNTTSGAGVTLTKAKESYCYLLEGGRDKLDKDKIWNHLTDAEIEKALRGWAKATGHREQMEGAAIGWRTKGVTR